MDELRNKEILLISPEKWGDNYVSKHHYALELVKRGNNVYFLNPPTNGGSKAEFSLKAASPKGLYLIDQRPKIRGFRFFPFFIRKLLLSYQIDRLLKACRLTSFDLVWSFEGSRFFDLEVFGEKVMKIFHSVDLVQDQNIERISRSADLVLCSNEVIKNKLIRYNKRVYKVHHGFFEKSSPIEIQLKDNGKIKAGYLGNLSIPFLDWELAWKLVQKEPQVDFYFMGPKGKSNLMSKEKKQDDQVYFQLVQKAENTYFTGAIPSEQVMNYLERMDVLMILYRADEFRKQLATSHKVMEYLGAGKVVVGTWTEEFKEDPALVQMTEDKDELPKLFHQVIQGLSFHNSPSRMKKRKAFAQGNTYSKQVEKIAKLIGKLAS